VTTWDKLPRTWPDHFDEAIHILNRRILPAVKFSPKELLLGLVVNTPQERRKQQENLRKKSQIAKQGQKERRWKVKQKKRMMRWMKERRAKTKRSSMGGGDAAKFERGKWNSG
jgi:hypothetical protein